MWWNSTKFPHQQATKHGTKIIPVYNLQNIQSISKEICEASLVLKNSWNITYKNVPNYCKNVHLLNLNLPKILLAADAGTSGIGLEDSER